MIALHLSPRRGDIEKVERLLSGMPKIAGKVLSRGINRALAGMRTDASREIRKELNVRKETVDSTSRLSKATASRLSASLESTGRPLPLSKFIGTRWNRKMKGASVQIKKSHGKKIIPRTFMVTMKSGHVGVFRRIGKERAPIQQLYSSRVPDVFSNQAVIEVVLKKADERLHKNLTHELEYEIGKLKR